MPDKHEWRFQKFTEPFKNKCVGVCLTQAYGGHGSLTNVGADRLLCDGFYFYTEGGESQKGIYYIAFGY